LLILNSSGVHSLKWVQFLKVKKVRICVTDCSPAGPAGAQLDADFEMMVIWDGEGTAVIDERS